MINNEESVAVRIPNFPPPGPISITQSLVSCVQSQSLCDHLLLVISVNLSKNQHLTCEVH